MITTVLCYSTTSGIAVADYGKPSRVDMGNVGVYAVGSYFNGDAVTGYATRFEDFTIWPLTP